MEENTSEEAVTPSTPAYRINTDAKQSMTFIETTYSLAAPERASSQGGSIEEQAGQRANAQLPGLGLLTGAQG